jgi:polysaccharide pyruvyl transferase WcaK-like protein
MNNFVRPRKIGLFGPYGFGNLGDASIQQAMIQHIRLYFQDVQIYGFSLNPEDTLKRHGIQSFSINPMPESPNSLLGRIPHHLRYSRWMRVLEKIFYRIPLELILLIRAFRNLKDFDLLIVSGGGQLDDYWGGAKKHPYTLFKWAIIAKLRKTKFVFVSVGAGPLDAALSRWFIKNALSLAAYRSYRDENSKKFIEEKVGFYRQDPIYPDLAYSLIVTNNNQPVAPKTSRLVVGIGPMAYFDPRVWAKKDDAIYRAYLKKLALFIIWLIEKKHTILFLPGNFQHDQPAIKDLQDILRQMGVSDAQGQLLEPNIDTVDELVAQLTRTDLVVATRFHSILLATLVNKPVLALSYHEKVDVLMHDTGQAEYRLSIDDFDVDTLIERFTALETNRGTIEKQLTQNTQQYRAALDEQYERIFSIIK